MRDVTAREAALSGRDGLAAVRALLYGRIARRMLHEELAALLDPGAAIGRCRLERAKFKPGRKLTGYYTVEIVGPARRDVRMVEAVWYAAGENPATPAGEPAMEEEARVAGVAAPFRRLHAEAPSLGARLRVSPLDVAYPQLVRLCRPDHVREMLAAAYEKAGSPEGAAPRYQVTTVRYRPRQRHVLRYDPKDGWRAEPVFAKLYRDGTAARAMRVAAALAGLLDGLDAGVTAARPLPAPGEEEEGVVLFPAVAGAPLSRRLRNPGAGPNRHLARAGALLRALHRDPGDVAVDLRGHEFAAELAAVARAAEHAGPLLPVAAARIDRLLAAAAELGAAMPMQPPRFAHGDYKTDHLWVARGRLTLLDFDSCCLAEPAVDVGKFLADLTWWFAATGKPGLAEAQQAFLAGYGAVTAEQLARARLYEAVVLTKLTIRRLRRFELDWGERTQRLVARAGGLLDAVAAGHAGVQDRTL